MRRVEESQRGFHPAVYVAVLIALASAGLAWPLPSDRRAGPDRAAAPSMASHDDLVSTSLYVPTNDWADRLNSDEHWRSRRGGGSSWGNSSFGGWSPPRPHYAPPAGLTRIPGVESLSPAARGRAAGGEQGGKKAPAAKPVSARKTPARTNDDDGDESPWTKEESRGTYRTLCVRMCDGYYWPISFSTNKDNLDRDAKVCERSCGTPARLYHHENPGQQPDDMEDLRGKRYKDLKVAFRYRTQDYDAACTCKPQPWDEAALARHQRYADLADRKKGGKKTVEARSRIGERKASAPELAGGAGAEGVVTATLTGTAGHTPTSIGGARTDALGDGLLPFLTPEQRAISFARRQSLALGELPRLRAAATGGARAHAPLPQTRIEPVRKPAQSTIRLSSTATWAAGPPPVRPRPQGPPAVKPINRDQSASVGAPAIPRTAPGRARVVTADGRESQVR